uniref:Uncharacterized protein n=1 Tax=Arabidopsis thaliana TaxID=3702 RepID=Q56ZG0_ARATH|nr:hypothetical protein [Arabidopsis thaliana]
MFVSFPHRSFINLQNFLMSVTCIFFCCLCLSLSGVPVCIARSHEPLS